MSKLTEQQLHNKAQKRVDIKYHLVVYVLVNILLWVIWAVNGMGYIWPAWVTGGWGLGLILHIVGPLDLFSVEKEKEKLRKENQ